MITTGRGRVGDGEDTTSGGGERKCDVLLNQIEPNMMIMMIQYAILKGDGGWWVVDSKQLVDEDID